jgi:hypothetical protein
MHQPVLNHLESYLQGVRNKELESHIAACPDCREQVALLEEQSVMLRTLSAQEVPQMRPGFYGRVIARIESQAKPGFWSLLLDPTFGRRLVYGSLSLVILMSVYLVATEPATNTVASSSPEMILSQPKLDNRQPIGSNPQRDRDTVLVNLATFSE